MLFVSLITSRNPQKVLRGLMESITERGERVEMRKGFKAKCIPDTQDLI